MNRRRSIVALVVLLSIVQNASGRATGDTDSSDRTGPPVVLRFAGDLLLAEHYERSAANDPGRAFAEFNVLREADVAVVNLESPITVRGRPERKPFTFRMHPRFLPAVKECGIDLVSLANNHVWDYGEIGFFDTLKELDSAGIRWMGAGRNEAEARAPVLMDVGAEKLAFLAYYGGGEARKSRGGSPGVADRRLPQIVQDVETARTNHQATHVIVTLHWGTERATSPDREQIAFARAIVDAGASAVIGHHPHVLQGIEMYKGGVIAYSLGNFVFGGNSRHTYDTALLELRVWPRRLEYEVIPLAVREWQCVLPDAATGERIRELVRKRSADLHR